MLSNILMFKNRSTMKNLFRQNIELLRKQSPHMADFLENINKPEYRVSNKKGLPILEVATQSGKILPIDHPDSPIEEAESFIPNNKAEHSFFILMGMGLGHLLFETVKKYPKSKIFVIEHDPMIFKRALETFDFTPYFENQNIEFFVGYLPNFVTRQFLLKLHNQDNSNYLPNLDIIQNERIVSLSKQYYSDIAKAFTLSVNQYWTMITGNDVEDPIIGLRQSLANLKNLNRCISLEPLKNQYRKQIGIVVSSGPSLNNKLDDLKKLQDKALIVCADSALKKLLDHDIKPFAVACLERDEVNGEYLKNFDIPKDIILVAPPLIIENSFNNYPGPLALIYKNGIPFTWLPQPVPLWSMGMSCAHLSLATLLHLGCEKIGLVGQDLAYDRESGTSHFSGVHHTATDQFEAEEMQRVYGIDNQGTMIPSNSIWLMFRDQFADMASYNTNAKIYNVMEKEKGLFIPEIERIEPNLFFEKLSQINDYQKPNVKILEEEITKQVPEFNKALNQKIDLAKKDFQFLRENFHQVINSQNADDYFLNNEKLFSNISSDTKTLFLDIIRPIAKRFDANVRCLWSEELIQKEIPLYINQIQDIMDRIEKILDQHYPY